MTTEPLVSIALCTYNGERFLHEQIDSILSQTHTNIELVIVDDRSIDGTVGILRDYEVKDSRIRLFVNECNLGYNQNFEKAISFCSGEFIAVSDQDDIWLSDKITSLLNNIGDYLLIYGNSELIDSEGKPLGVQIISPNRNSSNFLNYKSILLQNFVTGHNILFKKEALQYILPFPQNSFYDWWIGFVLLYEKKITYLNKICTFYRTHDFSVMSQLNSSKQNRMARYYSETALIFNQLRDFKNYKNLQKTDRDFFTKFESAFNEKINSYFAIQLFDILLRNFNSLFPDNHKPLIKRLAFLMRYCRGLKLIKATSKNHK